MILTNWSHLPLRFGRASFTVEIWFIARVLRGPTNAILPLKPWWMRCLGLGAQATHSSLLESSGGRLNDAATGCGCLFFKIPKYYTINL